MEQALRDVQELRAGDAEPGQGCVQGPEMALGRLVGTDVLGCKDRGKGSVKVLVLPAKPARCTLDRMMSW